MLSHLPRPWTGLLLILLVLVTAALLLHPRGRTHLLYAFRTLRTAPRLSLGLLSSMLLLFPAGVLGGRMLPAVTQMLEGKASQVLGMTGISAARSDVLTFAAAIFVWNTLVGLLLTTTVPSLLLGYGGVAVLLPRSFAVGMALSGLPNAVLLAHLPTVVIELSAYMVVPLATLIHTRAQARQLQLRARSVMTLGSVKALVLASVNSACRSSVTGALMLLVAALYESPEVLLLVPTLK